MKLERPKSQNLGNFFLDLCFIWQSHIFQFLGCALPIGFWQLLMNPKDTNLDPPYSTGASTELYLSILRKNHMAASILLPGPTLPKLSTNIDRQTDLFSKITCHFPGRFLPIFLPKFCWLFFGHSLFSYSKRRHLSTSRVILWPLSYHPIPSLSYDDIIRYRIDMPIDVGGKWRPHGGPILGS